MRKKVYSIFLVLMLMFLVSGCPDGDSDVYGELVLSMPLDGLQVQTIVPGVDMRIVSLNIRGEGPNGRTFAVSDVVPGDMVLVEQLYQGEWRIWVDGNNSSGIVIGMGTSTVTIVPRRTQTVSITVKPIDGNGNLGMTVKWKKEEIDNPEIIATLTPPSGTVIDLDFLIDENNGIATYSAELPSGYYNLNIQVMENDFLAMGAVEVVRIINEVTTSGTIDFPALNIPWGSIYFDIDYDLHNPLDVTINGSQDLVKVGETIGLTASLSENVGNVIYTWSVNGQAKYVGSTFEVSLEAGVYRIDVSAFTVDGTQGGSTGVDVTFYEENITYEEEYKFDKAWGSYGTGDANFSGPLGIAISNDNIYIVDRNNNCVKVFDTDGNLLRKWGSNGTGSSLLNEPYGVCVDPDNNVYVSNLGSHSIKKYDFYGNFITSWGSLGSAEGQFNCPYGVASDSQGNIYVTDRLNSRVQKFTSDGTFLTQWGSFGTGPGQFVHPAGIAIDANDFVYVTNLDSTAIVQRFTSSGVFTALVAGFGEDNGEFKNPFGIAIDAVGNIFIADRDSRQIQKLTSNGQYTCKWGTYGTGDGEFKAPYSLAVDSQGNVYVTDYSSHRVQKFSLVP